jgi:hypothetical protein
MESRRYPGGLIGTVRQRVVRSMRRSLSASTSKVKKRSTSGSPLAVTTCCSGTTSPSMQ